MTAPPDKLELSALTHPDPRIRRAGFDLTHPYLEHCWSAVLGPSTVAFLRRLPSLWAEREPALVTADDLARSLGLGAGRGVHSRFSRTLDRAVRFHLAEWLEPGRALGVYLEVPPIPDHYLGRVPALTLDAHAVHITKHIDDLAARSQDATHRSPSDDMRARLDRIQGPSSGNGTALPGIAR